MSFSFNFDVHARAEDAADDGDVLQISANVDNSTTKHDTTDGKSATEPPPAKEAREHRPPSDPGSLLEDAVSETVRMGTLPPLHFLNETVLERTAPERDDRENILSRTAAQRSDLISGVYEGGLRVWECTYDLLELLERDGETFGGKVVLDLGCGAALLGILALKRGAGQVHFQDYNSTVIDQLTLPNVLLNCEEEEEEEEESEEEDEEEVEGTGKGKRVKEDESPKETRAKKQEAEEDDGGPALKKQALDPSLQHASVARCRFFSGDWTTFLALVLKEEPSPKYDIIFTSETIYNAAYYPALHDTLHRLLAPGGLVYLATKAHYFGVGGGLHLFEEFVEQRGVFALDRLWDMNEGLQRHVVALRFKKTKAS